MSKPVTYPAVWWVPDNCQRFSDAKVAGVLTYNGEEGYSTLEVIFDSTEHSSYRAYESYDVIWGQAVGGQVFSLFNCVMIRAENYTKYVFQVNYILVGEHVRGLDEPSYQKCVTSFQYLRNWAFDQKMSSKDTGNHTIFDLDMGRDHKLSNIEFGNRIISYLWVEVSFHVTRYTLNANERTNYVIDSEDKLTIRQYLNFVAEFAEFFSIAVFCPQHPETIQFKNKDDFEYCQLLFRPKRSEDPRTMSLIKFDELRDRFPDIFKRWHDNHEQAAPIIGHLIRSMRYDTPFDSSDFLIIAQALDGYFKRFVNNKDGKNTQKYEDGIKKLLKSFNGVEILNDLNIDTVALKDSRDKYSHLIPDDDKKLTKALEGKELLWLTQKCRILLACCILDLLGLSTDEINICCNHSPLGAIKHSLPIES